MWASNSARHKGRRTGEIFSVSEDYEDENEKGSTTIPREIPVDEVSGNDLERQVESNGNVVSHKHHKQKHTSKSKTSNTNERLYSTEDKENLSKLNEISSRISSLEQDVKTFLQDEALREEIKLKVQELVDELSVDEMNRKQYLKKAKMYEELLTQQMLKLDAIKSSDPEILTTRIFFFRSNGS